MRFGKSSVAALAMLSCAGLVSASTTKGPGSMSRPELVREIGAISHDSFPAKWSWNGFENSGAYLEVNPDCSFVYGHASKYLRSGKLMNLRYTGSLRNLRPTRTTNSPNFWSVDVIWDRYTKPGVNRPTFVKREKIEVSDGSTSTQMETQFTFAIKPGDTRLAQLLDALADSCGAPKAE